MRVLLPLLAVVSGCWGNCGFADDGCQPPPVPDPCGDRRRVVVGGQIAAADDGGAFVISFEGRAGEQLVARRIDSSGALLWTVPFEDIGLGIYPVAAGDTLVLFLGDNRILGLRDGGIAFRTNAPEAPKTLRCRISTAVRRDGGIDVVGSVARVEVIGNGTQIFADTLVGCSYSVGVDGAVSDALLFGVAKYNEGIMPGRLPAIVVSTGGFAIGTQNELLRYDAAGQLVWAHPIVWPGPIVESSGSFFVLSGAADLVHIPADGATDTALVSWSSERSIRVLDVAPVARGVVVALEWTDAHAIALVDEHGLVWQRASSNISKISASAMRVIVDGDALTAYDLDGNVRWTRGGALDAFAAPDASTRVVDRTTIDECRQAATVSSVDRDGVVLWTWTSGA